MELPGSRIPWLRAVGAAGGVAALVVGGAVTTAGAIDDPGGAEPAKVQVMATDADGNWFSCDVSADLGAGPAGDGVTLAITGTAAAEADGASYGVVVTGVEAAAGGAPGEAPAPALVSGGAAGVQTSEGGAAFVAGSAVATAEGDGTVGGPVPAAAAEMVLTGEAPALPLPSEVRQGTAEECGGLNVTVGEAAIPAPAPGVPGVPAGFGASTGSDGAGGQDQEG